MSVKTGFKKFFSEISARRKYLHGHKGILEKTHRNLKKKHPDGAIGKTGRITGLGLIDLSWFLFCLMKFTAKDTRNGLNFVFLDNAILDKLEKEKRKTKIGNADNVFKKFFKNLQKSHPTAAARMHLWMLYALFAGLTVSGIKIVKNKDDIKKDVKERYTKPKEIKQIKEKPFEYNPKDINFTENFIDDYWEEIVIGLLELETYFETPKLQSNEKRYTFGVGLTWFYENGEQQPCVGKYVNMAANCTDKEIWNQINQHCKNKKECMGIMRKRLNKYGFTKISQQQIQGLFFAGYQGPANLNGIIYKLQKAGDNTQKIVDSFLPGNSIATTWRNGTIKRRWWCAMLYIGKITVADFVNMDRDAFSQVKVNKIMKDGHFLFDDETIQYALSMTNPSKGTVKDFIISRHVLDDIDTVYIKKNSKVISFNNGIMKIKEKQTHTNNNNIYSNNYYTV